MKFTQLQKKIIQHRLDVPDCITEVLTAIEDTDEAVYFTDDQVAAAIAQLQQLLDSDAALTRADFQDNEALSAVLYDCIDGSTWCGTMVAEIDFEVSKQRFAAHQRAMAQLAEKCLVLTGKKPYAPTC